MNVFSKPTLSTSKPTFIVKDEGTGSVLYKIRQQADDQWETNLGDNSKFKCPVAAFNALSDASNWTEVAGYSILIHTMCGTAITMGDDMPWMVETLEEAEKDLREDEAEGVDTSEFEISMVVYCYKTKQTFAVNNEEILKPQ